MKFQSEFGLGDIVYIKHDPRQLPRMIVAVGFRGGAPLYELACGNDSSNVSEFELSEHEDVVKKVTQ